MREKPPLSLVPIDHPARKMTFEQLVQAIDALNKKFNEARVDRERARIVNERAIYEAWRAEQFPKGTGKA